MDPMVLLRIIELATGILRGSTSGKVNEVIGDIQAFEQIAAGAAQQYRALAGKPLDLSLLTFEEPIAE